jgi:hypothetical protein
MTGNAAEFRRGLVKAGYGFRPMTGYWIGPKRSVMMVGASPLRGVESGIDHDAAFRSVRWRMVLAPSDAGTGRISW